MTPCSYCGAEPTQPFTPKFDFPVCRSCGILQHEALDRIAQMVRAVRWTYPKTPEFLEEDDEPREEVVESREVRAQEAQAAPRDPRESTLEPW